MVTQCFIKIVVTTDYYDIKEKSPLTRALKKETPTKRFQPASKD